MLLNFEKIEKLIFINENIIDSDILYILMDSYSQLQLNYPETHDWLKRIFKENAIYYSNYELAIWIIENEKSYEKLKDIEEFHKYSYSEKNICELFIRNNKFIEKLLEPSHVVNYLIENVDDGQIYESFQAFQSMCGYIFRNQSHFSFNQIVKYPEKFLLKLQKFRLRFSDEYYLKSPLTIYFNQHMFAHGMN